MMAGDLMSRIAPLTDFFQFSFIAQDHLRPLGAKLDRQRNIISKGEVKEFYRRSEPFFTCTCRLTVNTEEGKGTKLIILSANTGYKKIGI